MSCNIRNGFNEKTIFFTGVTGFVGKVLLHKLLSEFGNDLRRIYVLIRNKKGQKPLDRFKRQVCESKCFDSLRERLGGNNKFLELITKLVVPIPGDIMEDRLGISSEDYETLCNEVNYIIHVAATVNFQEKLNISVRMNVLGPLRVLSLAKKCKQLKAMVHTSTCYVNWGRDSADVPVLEQLYPLSFDPEEMVKWILAIHDNHIPEESSRILKEYNYPNTYCFTKSLAEQLLNKNRGSVPLAIVRPSIIGCALKEPCPGWVDALTAAGVIILTSSIGLLHELNCCKDYIADIVPVDFVVNVLIKAAFKTASEHKNITNTPLLTNALQDTTAETRSCDSLTVNVGSVHSADLSASDLPSSTAPMKIYAANTSGERNRLYWRLFIKPLEDMWNGNIKCPNSVGKMDIQLIESRKRYLFRYYLLRKLPFLTFKAVSKVPFTSSEKQQKALKKYARALKRTEMINDTFIPFTTKQWIFDNASARSISASLDAESKARFCTDVFEIQWYTYAQLYSWGITKFIMKSQNRDAPQLTESSTLTYMKANL